MSSRKYVVGFYCIKGNGHFVMYGDENWGACGNGWPVYIDLDDSMLGDMSYRPDGYFEDGLS